jgi:hypothetical protein
VGRPDSVILGCYEAPWMLVLFIVILAVVAKRRRNKQS